VTVPDVLTGPSREGEQHILERVESAEERIKAVMRPSPAVDPEFLQLSEQGSKVLVNVLGGD
jgi:hypothetical protein